MNLTKDELSIIKYDPNSIQKKILSYIESSTNGEVDITNPTNPFIMGLEATTVLTVNALEEMVYNTRKVFPSLARSNEELFHHLTDIEYKDIFSEPAMGVFILLVNLKDIENNGIKIENGVKVTIPKYTEITVENQVFTLLNNINISVFKNREVFVTQDLSDNEININEIGIIESNIITDDNNTDWVILETLFLQVKRTVIEDNIIASNGITKVFNLEPNTHYYFANIYYKNSNTNNEWKKIDKTHSDILYNRKDPMVKISYIDNVLTFHIPRAYINDDMVSGNLKYEIYTTTGRLELPIQNFEIEDFNITIGDSGEDEYTAVAPNLQILAKSRTAVNGGRNGKTTEELKESIINNTVKNSPIPITEYELIEYSKKYNFEINKIRDTLTDRLYVASKRTPSLPDNVKSRIDIYNVTTRLLLADVVDHPSIIVNDNSIVIKSNTILKDNNGVVNIVSKDELTRLNGLNKIELSNELKENRYFFNPYYYIIDKSDNTISSRLFNLDNPKLSNLRIINSIDTDIKVNISSYDIVKILNGYKLIFKPVYGDYFENLNKSLVKIQISIPVKNSTASVKFIGSLNTTTGLFTVDIESNFQINSDDSLTITNGEYPYSFKSVDLDSKAYLYIYTTDPSIITNSNTLNSELHENGEVLVKEYLNINFGREIKYLWDKVYLDYTARKYKRAETDIPLTYKEDVFKWNNEIGSIFNPVSFDEKCQKFMDLDYDIIHHKGDIVYDYGKIVYKYKKGDIIRDDNGNPVIDEFSGIVRFIDMLVLDYEYLIASNINNSKYLKEYLNNMESWLTDELVNINSITLDNTVIKFKPYKSIELIKIFNNNRYSYINHTVKPIITLYIDRNENITDELLKEFSVTIGDTLHTKLEDVNINITDIKSSITDRLPIELKGIKIEKITDDELEAFSLVDSDKRISIRKKLSLTTANDTIVEYDLELKVVKI